MDIAKLFDLAQKFADVPGVLAQATAAAREIAALAELVAANHDRAKHVLAAGEPDELDMIHAQTLAMIDAFDAELAKAAQS